jgi:hypothetical protein
MSEKPKEPVQGQEAKEDPGVPGGGRGRRDEVGGSGVYPASAGHVPDDAVVRTPGEWGGGAGGEQGGRSELHFTEEELRAIEDEADDGTRETGSAPPPGDPQV